MRKRDIIITAGIAAAWLAVSGGMIATAGTQPLIYQCQAQPCANSQEFEVFDPAGNPIYSVGESGGDAVFGDNRSVYRPGNVFSPSVVESYTTPEGYGSTSCTAPAVWISPTAFFTCVNGKWQQFLAVPQGGLVKAGK